MNMYKVIANKKEYIAWKKNLEIDLIEVLKEQDIEQLLSEQIEILDICYGEDRNLETDLGGYIIIFYGEEIREEFRKVLNYHNLKENEYEYEDTILKPKLLKKIQFRLYLCGSDYHVQSVMIINNGKEEKENVFETYQ